MIIMIGALAMAAFFATLPLMGVSAAKSDSLADKFLQTAAQGNQVEIALGRLAIQKAQSLAVKQFGARMIQDHQKASQEVQQLHPKQESRYLFDIGLGEQMPKIAPKDL